ncbi:MAG: LysR family transcriptional regulator [Alphaproteobacteria bacterium]|nr:LysR family transcriptional regulator [Alphaproteobacteria bacterium]
MDWDRLRIFHAVAEAGSFTHAGEKLNLSQSAISRQISALEESVKAPLFHRHARGLILTEQGDMLFRTVKDVFHKLSMVEARLAESKDRPSGPLKITTTTALGSTWLTPQIKEFIRLFPDVEVTLILSDEELDLGMRQADVAIRMSPPRQPDLVQRPLMSYTTKVYGAPGYLDDKGRPQSVEELDGHDIVVFGEETPMPVKTVNWLLEAGARPETPRRPILRVNSVYGVYRAVKSGLGLASLPEFMMPEKMGLEQVLPDLRGPTTQAYFVYPEELRHSKRISVFRDFLLRKVAETQF